MIRAVSRFSRGSLATAQAAMKQYGIPGSFAMAMGLVCVVMAEQAGAGTREDPWRLWAMPPSRSVWPTRIPTWMAKATRIIELGHLPQ